MYHIIGDLLLRVIVCFFSLTNSYCVKNVWISFHVPQASAHFIVLSSEHDLSPSSVQYDWLQNDLQHVDRNKTPWLIIESHRPLYEPENIPPERSTIEGIRRSVCKR